MIGFLDDWMVGKRPEALAQQSINPPIHLSKKRHEQDN
jgi:hypothetical protein